jgi:hypothetical protein
MHTSKMDYNYQKVLLRIILNRMFFELKTIFTQVTFQDA